MAVDTSDPTHDGMLREWGTRLFFGMPKKGKSQGTATLPRAGIFLTAAEVRERIRQVVRPGAKQVMVKITGGGRGMKAIAAHFRYMSRQGKPEVGGRGETLELEDERGNKLRGADDVKSLERSWQVAGSYIEDESPRREAFNVMLSMPAGTPPVVVHDAARDFARDIFEGHMYVFALHEDTDSPHVHMAVRAERRDGARLNPRKADLQRWRACFAEHLQARGIDAIATRAATRGQTRAPQDLWRLKAGDGVRKPREKERSVESVRKGRAESIEAWRHVSLGLAQSQQASDKALLMDVLRYVDVTFGDGQLKERLAAIPERRPEPDIDR